MEIPDNECNRSQQTHNGASEQKKNSRMARSHATTKQAALHKLANHAGVPQDAVKAAIGEHDHRQQRDGTGG